MQLTKRAIGNLINRYRAVLKKCHLLNAFGSLALAGMLAMGGAVCAEAADGQNINMTSTLDTATVDSQGNTTYGDALSLVTSSCLTRASLRGSRRMTSMSATLLPEV